RPPAERLVMPRLVPSQVAGLTAVAVIVALIGGIAWIAAPNTWDSMTYHLPRIMHWEQNQTLASYATHEPRQLYMSPWAEIAAAQFQILLGGDRFANLIQWFSMAGSLLATWVLVGQLGGGTPARVLGVLAGVTIPMGLLQAVSTQTDHVVAFYILATLVLLRDAARSDDRTSWWGAAASTGLAALTKATAYVFLAPFLAAFVGYVLWRRRRAAWGPLVAFGVIVLLVNLGHYSRNVRLYGSPLTPVGLGEYHEYANQSHSPATLISNVVRSAAVHLNPPAPRFVEASFEAIEHLHQWLEIDASDPRSTWAGMRFQPTPVRIHEDFSGNFFHGLLVLGVLALAGFSGRLRREHPALIAYAGMICLSFLLFAGYLKWAPWHARLHLSLFWLWAPALGVVWCWRSARLSVAIALVLLAQAVPFVGANPLHPLWGTHSIFTTPRGHQLFLERPLLGEFTRGASRRIARSGCRAVGLSLPPDAWEYPLWVLLRQEIDGSSDAPPLRLESLEPTQASRRFAAPGFRPCAVICLRCTPERRVRYEPTFGEPQVIASDDLLFSPYHMLFLRPPSPDEAAAGATDGM
ncbi:MAG: glycosyltransferase family 39 protein, partial [Acidobacteriota bacterium]